MSRNVIEIKRNMWQAVAEDTERSIDPSPRWTAMPSPPASPHRAGLTLDCASAYHPSLLPDRAVRPERRTEGRVSFSPATWARG